MLWNCHEPFKCADGYVLDETYLHVFSLNLHGSEGDSFKIRLFQGLNFTSAIRPFLKELEKLAHRSKISEEYSKIAVVITIGSLLYVIFHVLMPCIRKLLSVRICGTNMNDIGADGIRIPNLKCHPPLMPVGSELGLLVLIRGLLS